jgi:hypothetical protein
MIELRASNSWPPGTTRQTRYATSRQVRSVSPGVGAIGGEEGKNGKRTNGHDHKARELAEPGL